APWARRCNRRLSMCLAGRDRPTVSSADCKALLPFDLSEFAALPALGLARQPTLRPPPEQRPRRLALRSTCLGSSSKSPFINVGPTVRAASVHRFAASLLPAGPPTSLATSELTVSCVDVRITILQ